MSAKKIKKTSKKRAEITRQIRRRKRLNWRNSVNYILRQTKLVHPNAFWKAVISIFKNTGVKINETDTIQH